MEVIAEEVRSHHPYSPSTLPSLEACPCFKSRESTHIRTIVGTISHKVTETCEDDNRLDDDDAAAAAECLDFYESRRKAALDFRYSAVDSLVKSGRPYADHYDEQLAFEETQGKTPQIIELKETYLAIDKLKFNDGVESTTAGYVDRAIITHDRAYAELFDWKFGFWPVEKAENNLQGFSYVLGLFREYPTLASARFFFKQPHTHEISHVYVSRADVAKLYLRIQVVVARARAARIKMAKGDYSMAEPHMPLCNFCANIGDCPKVTAFACNVARKFYPLEIPEDISPMKVMDPHNTTLAMRLSSVMAVWSKAFRDRVTDRVIRRDADCPAGFVITSRSDRKVTDPAKLREIAMKYISEAEYQKLLSQEPPFGALEDAIKEKAPRGQKKSTLEQFQQETLETGAVERGMGYSFLKAVAEKENTLTT